MLSDHWTTPQRGSGCSVTIGQHSKEALDAQLPLDNTAKRHWMLSDHWTTQQGGTGCSVTIGQHSKEPLDAQ